MRDIFERELAGEMIPINDPEFYKILEVINQAFELTSKLNVLAPSDAKVREILKKLFNYEIDETITIIPPFYTDFGRNTRIGKNSFIQQCCTFFDRGGITIGDNVFIGPKVNLITLNHNINPNNRSTTYCKPITIENNVWIGINSTILQGITLGENSIVGANSVVTKDVPKNTIVAGNPAKIIKEIN